MGKLLQKYTKPDTTVELVLPLSGDTLKFKRPSIGEIKQLQDFSSTLEGDPNADVRICAKVLKTLCAEFADESEKTLQDDLASLEAPDRAAILPFYFEMLGINREEIWKSISQNLETTTKN
jgi:hypothetical protein